MAHLWRAQLQPFDSGVSIDDNQLPNALANVGCPAILGSTRQYEAGNL